MKKIFLCVFVSLVALLLSCNNHKQNRDGLISNDVAISSIKAGDTLKAIINANIHKQPTIDTVFLGFTFGMTKKQTTSHFNQLIKEKKLVYNDSEPHYRYPMTFSLIKANAAIAPEFQDGKLYKLTLLIQGDDDMATTQTVYLQTAEAYMKKYASYTLFQEPGLVDENLKQLHWIKNNLHIYIHESVQGILVSYSNMLIEEPMGQMSKGSDSSKAKTNKDI